MLFSLLPYIHKRTKTPRKNAARTETHVHTQTLPCVIFPFSLPFPEQEQTTKNLNVLQRHSLRM